MNESSINRLGQFAAVFLLWGPAGALDQPLIDN
jgi:hypothetical protein